MSRLSRPFVRKRIAPLFFLPDPVRHRPQLEQSFGPCLSSELRIPRTATVNNAKQIAACRSIPSNIEHCVFQALLGDFIGFNAGNGQKLSYSQAELDQASCLAVS